MRVKLPQGFCRLRSFARALLRTNQWLLISRHGLFLTAASMAVKCNGLLRTTTKADKRVKESKQSSLLYSNKCSIQNTSSTVFLAFTGRLVGRTFCNQGRNGAILDRIQPKSSCLMNNGLQDILHYLTKPSSSFK